MSLSGFLLVDKPPGITSFAVIARLRKITGIRKIGHAGTLDPFATGLLIIAVGREATREISTYVKLDKTYEATFCFGATTPTLDPEGIVEKDESFNPTTLTKEAIVSTLPQFTGTIEQVPPSFSAIKIDGQRAYDLARAGKEVDMPTRSITVQEFTCHDVTIQDNLVYGTFTISCASGTYIRALARDLALALGTTGYVTQLHRTRIGGFSIENSHTLESLALRWEDKLIAVPKPLAE